MTRRIRLLLAAGLLAVGLWLGSPAPAGAQNYTMDRFFYYPYYYFPHNYWPTNSPPWPERPGEPYRRPPAYMAYPPFHENHWNFPLHERMSYYRGFHFWLDAF
jgi:hypothetical protein